MSTYWLSGRGIVKPCRVLTSFSNGTWCAEQPETGIWGAGRSEAGAIEDIRVALRQHRDVLMSETTVSPNLSHQRRWLAEHLAAS